MTNIIPSMRFDEFKYSWKVTTLGEITRQYRESNKNVHHQNLLSLSYGKIVRKDIESKKGLLPASFDTYQIIKKDIIVFRVTDLQNDKKSLRVGISEEEGIITPAYVCVECDTRVVDPHYLYTLLHYYDDITKVYYKMGDGMRQTLAYSDLKELKVYLPNFPEQHKIVECFELLDKQIQISSKKIASLRQMKTASLHAMFPQKGETRPRVRFKGFEDEYSSMTANELFKTFDERNHPELPVLSACQDIRGMAPRSESGYDIFHDKSNEVTYKRVLPGQFVIHLRSFQGGFAHSSVEGICSPAYTVFGFKEDDKHDDYYWKYIFMSKAFIDRLKLITYGIRDGRSISFKEFMEMDFVFPSYEEQKQISIFFRTTDKQISLEDHKLESLKLVKSSCLYKMFV